MSVNTQSLALIKGSSVLDMVVVLTSFSSLFSDKYTDK